MKIVAKCLLALLCVVGLLAPATTAPAATTWAHEGWTKADNWTLGGDIRIRWLRTENMSNMGTRGFVHIDPVTQRPTPLDQPGVDVPLGAWNDIDIWRQRARLWVRADLPKNITTYFRTTQEFYWGGDAITGGSLGGVFGQEARWAMLLDNAWIQVARPFDLPFTLKGGRMDLRYGEGFLIIDTDASYAGDGSRTFFFDAIKATVHLDFIKTDVDLLYSKSHEVNFNNSQDDDDLYGLYATSTIADPVKIEAYLLARTQRHQRNENVMWRLGVGINRPARDQQTWGARVSGRWGVFSFAAEAAGQTGTIHDASQLLIANTVQTPGEPRLHRYKWDPDPVTGDPVPRTGSVDIMAYAGYAHGNLNLKDLPLKPNVQVGYWFYSGDDRESSKWGGFDDMYGQAPIHGEYYLYSHLDTLSSPNSDWDPYMHTNLHFPRVRAGVTLIENLTFNATYQAHFAHRNTQLAAGDHNSFTNSQGGHFRGHYVYGVLQYVFSPNLTAHLRWEAHFPGDYYPADAKTGQFGRVEVVARF